MIRLHLYGTSHCHLCDQAKSELLAFMPFAKDTIELVEVDIVSDDSLYSELEEKIPVLENQQTGQRLYWPFNTPDILSIL
jgi:hypothetical protein